MSGKFIEGFSKLSKEDKIRIISETMQEPDFTEEAVSFWHPHKQELFDSFSENTLTNFYLPFGVAPNFLINNKVYHIPMVTEESSVVAAAASAAKFWVKRGGFHSKVVSSTKKGHIHFLWNGDQSLLNSIFPDLKVVFLAEIQALTANMQQRGGGIKQIKLEDFSSAIENYYRILVDFETVDSMGANFINSVLEAMATSMQSFFDHHFPQHTHQLEIIMSILSNHVPECLVECQVSCPAEHFDKLDNETPWQAFTRKFKTAVDIANVDPYRAATHNKGIMNGIDAVVIATGNDFRAVEAGAHCYAASSGVYKSLSTVEIENNTFSFKLKMPLAVGTVGGLTTLHPMSKRAMQMLGNPNARELMTIIAAAGLANNFSAVKALVTKGIQQGHMKMHLSNMLLRFNLSQKERKQLENYFLNKEITYAAVNEYVNTHFQHK